MRASPDPDARELAAASPADEFDEDQPKPKPKKPKKIKEKKPDVELPMLIEIGFTFSAILLFSVSIAVAAVSFFTGASQVEVFLRTLVTIVSMGAVLWLFNWQFTTGVLQGAMRALEDEDAAKRAEQQAEAETGLDSLQPEAVREG